MRRPTDNEVLALGLALFIIAMAVARVLRWIG